MHDVTYEALVRAAGIAGVGKRLEHRAASRVRKYQRPKSAEKSLKLCRRIRNKMGEAFFL